MARIKISDLPTEFEISAAEMKSIQAGNTTLSSFTSHPWIIATPIATAIAVPTAIHDADSDEEEPSS